MRALPLLFFLALAATLAFMLVQKNAMHPPGPSSAPAPLPALTLTSFDKKTGWDANKLNGQVTLINIFASWCTPCAAEMPELLALKKQFPGVVMHGVVWNDTPETIRPWLKKHGNPFDHLWLDAGGASTIALGVRGIPESILVDASGNVRYRLPGPVTAALRASEIDALIEQLLNEAK